MSLHRIDAPTVGIGIATLVLASATGIGAAHYAATLDEAAMWWSIIASAITFGISMGCSFSIYKDATRDR